MVIITLKTLAIFRIESIPNKKAQKLFLEPENSCSYHIFSSETIIYKKHHPKFRYVYQEKIQIMISELYGICIKQV